MGAKEAFDNPFPEDNSLRRATEKEEKRVSVTDFNLITALRRDLPLREGQPLPPPAMATWKKTHPRLINGRKPSGKLTQLLFEALIIATGALFWVPSLYISSCCGYFFDVCH
ncbi:hypothetical protein CDAR_277881 [Caerostris darwini]|uniref:Uncharacterized protein n=1 Tax=Caerostris darwini TaxID=1538125 RepID=A0AAV4PJH5_9ARAC|nr:hypothetical protein CDAR_277881 [Caerostris darwini]